MKNTWKLTGATQWIVAGTCVAASLTASALENTNINGITWRWTYEGDVDPASATPAWTQSSQVGGTQSSDGDILTVVSSNALSSTMINLMNGGVGNPDWDGSGPTTVEFRMRNLSLFSGTDFGSAIQLANGGRHFTFFFGTNLVSTASGAASTFSVDVTDYHTYRITMFTNATYPVGVAFLSVDSWVPVLTNFGSSVALNRLYFGDPSATSSGGVSEWDFVRWTNTEAAVPEPSALLLPLLAGATAFVGRRRRARR